VYLDPEASVVTRIEDLLSRMELPEKVGQLLMLDAQHGDLEDIVSAKLAGSVLHVAPALMPEAVALARRTRLGIPLLTADDGIHGHSFWPGAAIFPTQLAMACSWDPALLQRVARTAATEIAATGIHWTFSPVLCITLLRDPGRAGRERGRSQSAQAALVVPAPVRAGGPGRLPYLHARLPVDRRRAHHRA
jgi:beta-glucosidase